MGLAFSPVRPRVCSAKRTRFFSLWLTAHTTNCSSTLKKGASRSKPLLNDRSRSLFGGSPDPLLSSGRQLPLLLLLPAPRRPRPPTLFTSHSPCFFQPRAFAVCFPAFFVSELSAVLGLRAALPVRTLPPAGSARHSALLFHPSALRPSARSPSRPSARMPTPPMVLFFERQLHAILSARAPVFLLNK